MQKIKNIEFLRTFLMLSIVLHHMFITRDWCLCSIFPNIYLYSFIKSFIAFSYNSVEGFFIIAGFLLFLTFKNSIKVVDFIKKKYIRLTPVIVFSFILCLVGTMLKAFPFKIIPNLMTALLLNQFGVCISIGQNPVLWFTSVLFAGLLLYFCILKFVSKKYQTILITILTVLGYGILEILQHGFFNKPLKNYYFILNIGFLRGLGGIGLGCLIAKIFQNNYTKIQNFTPSKLKKILITFAEILSYVFVFWWLCFPHLKYNNIFFVIGFTVLFSLFIFKKGYLSNILDKDFWVFLGRYQYSMYVVHYVIIKIFGIVLWQKNVGWVVLHPVLPIVIMLLIILAVTIFAYHFVEIPCAKYLKDKLFCRTIVQGENK